MNSSDHRRRKLLPRVALGALIVIAVATSLVWTPRSPQAPALVEAVQAESTMPSAPAPRTVDTTPALPAPKTPLVETMRALQARADAGDAQAASRLYNDLLRCRVSAWINVNVAQTAKSAVLESSANLTAQQLDQKEKRLAHMQELLNSARANDALCAGVPAAALEQMVPATFRAAQLGDDNAASCYVDGYFLKQQGVLDHPEWLAQYKLHALDIADQSLERGNWTMARQFYDALGAVHGETLFGQLTGRDIAQQYRYAKLMQLGEDAAGSSAIDSEVSALLPSLSENDIAVGDIWARNTYQHFFASHADRRAVTSTEVCQMAKD